MSKRYWKAHVDDVQNTNVDSSDEEYLLDVFCRQMKELATTLARKAWFDLADFKQSHEIGCSEYKLTMEKYTGAGAEQWEGLFEGPNCSLRVFGTLEKD